MIRPVPAALHQWTAANNAARDAYRKHPNLDWCAIKNCPNTQDNACSGMCRGHKQAHTNGAALRLDEHAAWAYEAVEL